MINTTNKIQRFEALGAINQIEIIDKENKIYQSAIANGSLYVAKMLAENIKAKEANEKVINDYINQYQVDDEEKREILATLYEDHYCSWC